MKIPSDPLLHRRREEKFLEHVTKLLSDDRLRVDTLAGHRSVTTLIRDVTRNDRAMDLKRAMADAGMYDRELQNRMPLGEVIEVTLSQKQFFFFRKTVGRMRVLCAAPVDELLRGQEPQPMNVDDVQRLLHGQPPPLGHAPQTIVLMSTSGFTQDAHELADRSAGRAVVLVEPNGTGGWTVTAPSDMPGLNELFDPEGEDEKRHRARQEIEKSKIDLLSSGISAERIANRLNLPAALVEAELKTYAKATPGLVGKKLDGRFVVYREGSAAPPAGALAASPGAGGISMPFIDRMRALFARKGEEEKKIAFLSERRTALSQQRDQAFEDMGSLEQQEADLKEQFKAAPGTITKKRITSQMLQLRKDLERRQQLLGVLNQQINVVSTHLHNLELVQQGVSAQLPDTEEMTEDAVKAEEMLAELEASGELAGTVAMHAGASGLTAEEQALFDELEAETQVEKESTAQADAAAANAAKGKQSASPASRDRQSSAPPPIPTSERRRSEPEAG